MEIVNENEITAFMIDVCPGNGYFNTPICKKCVEQAKKIFKNFKIYTPNDDIVKQCMSEFKDEIGFFLKEKRLEFVADIIRIYILNKTEKSLYLDSDFFVMNNKIKKDLELNKVKFFYDCFCCIWNGGDKNNIFDKILKFYKVEMLKKESFKVEMLKKEYYHDRSVLKSINQSHDNFVADLGCQHYFEGFIFGFKFREILNYINLDDKSKMEAIKKITNLKDYLMKNFLFLKRYQEDDDYTCGISTIFYWGYIFDTLEDTKKYIIENKSPRSKAIFLES